jgi:beta-phosphoglucomutase-like phosphatase (HAD superfamily)
VLGYVSERMWFDARKEACAKFGVSPDEIELESMGPTLAWQRNRFEATKRGKESVRKVRANRRKAKK